MASSFQAYGLRRLKCFFPSNVFLSIYIKGCQNSIVHHLFTGSATSNKAVCCQSMAAQSPLAFTTESISCISLPIYLSPHHFYLDQSNTSVYCHHYSLSETVYEDMCSHKKRINALD